MIIAIDGPAASGKGTLARRIASHLDYAYLDTGKLYRAVGMKILREGGSLDDPTLAEHVALAIEPVDLQDPTLFRDEAGAAASRVAVFPGVRSALLDFQRRFASLPPHGKTGAVLDGRDIGTEVCPDADVKIFVTASPEVRAHRRFLELKQNGIDAKESAVLQDMIERDARDRNRAIAPLVPANDAIVLDTSGKTADEAFDAALEILAEKRDNGPLCAPEIPL